MPRVIPVLIGVVLLIASLIDISRTPSDQIRGFPKWAWMILVIVLPYLGPAGWFLSGRPRGATGTASTSPTPDATPGRFLSYRQHTPVAPDDDPEFLESLKRSNEHENLLREWEQDLKRREEELREHEEPDESDQST